MVKLTTIIVSSVALGYMLLSVWWANGLVNELEAAGKMPTNDTMCEYDSSCAILRFTGRRMLLKTVLVKNFFLTVISIPTLIVNGRFSDESSKHTMWISFSISIFNGYSLLGLHTSVFFILQWFELQLIMMSSIDLWRDLKALFIAQ